MTACQRPYRERDFPPSPAERVRGPKLLPGDEWYAEEVAGFQAGYHHRFDLVVCVPDGRCCVPPCSGPDRTGRSHAPLGQHVTNK